MDAEMEEELVIVKTHERSEDYMKKSKYVLIGLGLIEIIAIGSLATYMYYS